eukprot:4517708-Pyramimonas_sp.AAC.1
MKGDSESGHKRAGNHNRSAIPRRQAQAGAGVPGIAIGAHAQRCNRIAICVLAGAGAPGIAIKIRSRSA